MFEPGTRTRNLSITRRTQYPLNPKNLKNADDGEKVFSFLIRKLFFAKANQTQSLRRRYNPLGFPLERPKGGGMRGIKK